MYYQTCDSDIEHIAFIGRFVIFHKGHSAMIEKKHRETGMPILILIRDTTYDYLAPVLRADIIKIWMQKKNIPGAIMFIPDIKGVYYGRGVGYEIEEIEVDESIKTISGTEIRRLIREGNDSWHDYVDHVLIQYIGQVIE